MITLMRRRLEVRPPKKAEQIAITSRDVRNLVTNVYGRAVLHLNANELGAKYSYWVSMNREDAEALRDQLTAFLDRTLEGPPDATSGPLTNDS